MGNLASRRLDAELFEISEELRIEEIVARVQRDVRSNDSWRSDCVNLNAAESVMSPLAQSLLNSDLERRVFFDHPYYMGSKFVEDINLVTIQLLKRIFEAGFVEHRCLSGSVADALILRCTSRVGDSIAGIQPPIGHPTWGENGYPAFRGLKVRTIPFDFNEWEIDLERFARDTEAHRPRVIVIGHGSILFPHPLHSIREIAHKVGAKIWFDGAHVLGLIAGRKFPNPLLHGADFLTGSTQKTLSGPLGGLILLNDRKTGQELKSVFYQLLATIGHNRIAALAITLTEWLKFGEEYASQLVNNARELGKRLDKHGIEIKQKGKSYTSTHMILADISNYGAALEFAKKLERANIILSAIRLTANLRKFNGLRIGVTEMTRYGMKEGDMKAIAEFIARIIVEKERPESVLNEVVTFRRKFNSIRFCFEPRELK